MKTLKNGKVILSDGQACWFKDDKLHREDGPAVVRVNGEKEWWINGDPHREDGPAFEWSEGRFWVKHGQWHREDGPAKEYTTGKREWWFRGRRIDCSSQEEFERLKKLKAFW